MKIYDSLELDILSCLIQKPGLMDKVKLEEKHFIKYKMLWVFLKAIYKKFGDFDLTIMTTVSQNKFKIIDYIILLIDREPAPSKFETYQNLLLELYQEKKRERFLKDKIYKLATELYIGELDLESFETKLKSGYIQADTLFGKE